MRAGTALRNLVRCIAVLVGGSVFAGEITQTLQTEINRLEPTDEIAVIIRFRDPVDLRAFNVRNPRLRRENFIRALRSKTEIEHGSIQTLLIREGAKRERQLWLINGRSAELKAAAIARIARHSRVESIDLDRKIVLLSTPASCGVSPAGWNLYAVNAASRDELFQVT